MLIRSTFSKVLTIPATAMRVVSHVAGDVASSLLNELKAYYALSDLTDATGRGNTLTNNASATFTTGLLGNAVSLATASSQFLSRTDSADHRGGAKSFSVWAWVRPTTLANNRGIVVKYSTGREYVLYTVNSAPRFLLYNAGGSIIGDVAGTETMSTAAWFLCIGGYNLATNRVFVRLMGANIGVLYEVDVVGTPAVSATADFRIGNFSGIYWDGLIDEAGKSDKVLTEVEMQQLWNSRAGLTYPFSSAPNITIPTYAGATTGAGQLDNFQTAVSANYAKVLCIGDSWMERSFIPAQLRTRLQTEYGDGGIGYLSFLASSNGHEARISSYSRTGTWTETQLTGRGIDLCEITATTTATVNWTGTFDRLVIHYAVKSGGGSFRYRVDGGSYTTLNTNGTAAYGTSSITGLANTSHTVNVEWVSGSITVFGAEMTSGSTGVVVFKCGHTGTRADQWAAVNGANWTAAVNAFDPDLCLILLGTNDHANNVVPATFQTDLLTVVDRIPATCDVLLCSAADAKRDVTAGLTYPIPAYAEKMYNIVSLRDAQYFHGADLGAYGYVSKKSPTWWESTIHISATGSAAYADLIYNGFLTGL